MQDLQHPANAVLRLQNSLVTSHPRPDPARVHAYDRDPRFL